MIAQLLFEQLLDIHGTDRYPSVELRFMKVTEELGELSQAILKNKGERAIAKEFGDVGIALQAVGSKFGLDLVTCMQSVVNNETRNFA